MIARRGIEGSGARGNRATGNSARGSRGEARDRGVAGQRREIEGY